MITTLLASTELWQQIPLGVVLLAFIGIVIQILTTPSKVTPSSVKLSRSKQVFGASFQGVCSEKPATASTKAKTSEEEEAEEEVEAEAEEEEEAEAPQDPEPVEAEEQIEVVPEQESPPPVEKKKKDKKKKAPVVESKAPPVPQPQPVVEERKPTHAMTAEEKEVDSEIRKLKKKLREISDLKTREASGEVLTEAQLTKIAQEHSLSAAVQQAEGKMASLQANLSTQKTQQEEEEDEWVQVLEVAKQQEAAEQAQAKQEAAEDFEQSQKKRKKKKGKKQQEEEEEAEEEHEEAPAPIEEQVEEEHEETPAPIEEQAEEDNGEAPAPAETEEQEEEEEEDEKPDDAEDEGEKVEVQAEEDNKGEDLKEEGVPADESEEQGEEGEEDDDEPFVPKQHPPTKRQKEVMKTQKSIRDIEKLLEQQKAGKSLAQNQLDKIQKLDGLKEELELLEKSPEPHTLWHNAEVISIQDPPFGIEVKVEGRLEPLPLSAAHMSPAVDIANLGAIRERYSKDKDMIHLRKDLKVRLLRDQTGVTELEEKYEDRRWKKIDAVEEQLQNMRSEDKRLFGEESELWMKAGGEWSTEEFDGIVKQVMHNGVKVVIMHAREVFIRPDDLPSTHKNQDPGGQFKTNVKREMIKDGMDVKLKLKYRWHKPLPHDSSKKPGWVLGGKLLTEAADASSPEKSKAESPDTSPEKNEAGSN